MPVDVSPYATLGQGGGSGSLNLLGMLGQGAQLQNMLNQNAQFQQEFAAKKALGEVLAGAVDPETKRVDWKKAIVEGSKRPDLAWKMPELANQVAQREQMDAQTLKLALENEKEKMAAVSAVALTVAKQFGDNVKPENLVGPMADLHSRGFFSGPESVAALSQLSGKSGPELKQALLTIAGYGQRSADLLNGVAGTHGEYTDPTTGEKKQGWGSPLFGQITPTQVLPQQTQAPAAGRSAQQGAPAVSTLGPVQQKALESVQEYRKELQGDAQAASRNGIVVKEMEEALKHFKPGGGAEYYEHVARALQALGVRDENIDKVANGSLPATQEFMKLSPQLSTSLLRQVLPSGKTTNFEFKTFLDNNPNITLDPRSIKKIIGFIQTINNLSRLKLEHFDDLYNQRGGSLPGGMKDLSSYESYWNKKLEQHGVFGGGAR